MILFYPLFVLNWFLIRDFRDYFTSNTIVGRLVVIPLKEYVKLILFKLLFLFYIVLLPVLITPFSTGQVVLAFLILTLSAGLFGLIVLLPPHVNVYSQFPSTNEKREIGFSWFYHQLITTNDVTMDNWFSRHLMANFNYHLIHHLFPKLNYVYAKEATNILRHYCQQEGLPYQSLPLGKALAGHFKLILRNQIEFNVFEEEM